MLPKNTRVGVDPVVVGRRLTVDRGLVRGRKMESMITTTPLTGPGGLPVHPRARRTAITAASAVK